MGPEGDRAKERSGAGFLEPLPEEVTITFDDLPFDQGLRRLLGDRGKNGPRSRRRSWTASISTRSSVEPSCVVPVYEVRLKDCS